MGKTLTNKTFILILLSVLPVSLMGQTTVQYRNEEVKVINQLLYQIIDGERIQSFNKTDSTLVIYFNTTLQSGLDKDPLLNGNYKSNALIKKLNGVGLPPRRIVTSKIERIKGLEIIFEESPNDTDLKYSSNRIIGTLDISRISFNKELTKGYFYYSVYCGEDCGWGGLLEIEKKNETWEITKYLYSWVS